MLDHYRFVQPNYGGRKRRGSLKGTSNLSGLLPKSELASGLGNCLHYVWAGVPAIPHCPALRDCPPLHSYAGEPHTPLRQYTSLNALSL